MTIWLEGQDHQMGAPSPTISLYRVWLREEFFWNREGQKIFKHSSLTHVYFTYLQFLLFYI